MGCMTSRDGVASDINRFGVVPIDIERLDVILEKKTWTTMEEFHASFPTKAEAREKWIESSDHRLAGKQDRHRYFRTCVVSWRWESPEPDGNIKRVIKILQHCLSLNYRFVFLDILCIDQKSVHIINDVKDYTKLYSSYPVVVALPLQSHENCRDAHRGWISYELMCYLHTNMILRLWDLVPLEYNECTDDELIEHFHAVFDLKVNHKQIAQIRMWAQSPPDVSMLEHQDVKRDLNMSSYSAMADLVNSGLDDDRDGLKKLGLVRDLKWLIACRALPQLQAHGFVTKLRDLIIILSLENSSLPVLNSLTKDWDDIPVNECEAKDLEDLCIAVALEYYNTFKSSTYSGSIPSMDIIVAQERVEDVKSRFFGGSFEDYDRVSSIVEKNGDLRLIFDINLTYA